MSCSSKNTFGTFVDDNNNNGTQKPSCVAINHGDKVVVYDKKGTPRSYILSPESYQKIKSKSNENEVSTRLLCFSDHNVEHVSDLLTYCITEDGEHGVPETDGAGCYCGADVDEPHLHAHLYDERTCGLAAQKNGNFNKDISFLCSLTLYPDPDADDDDVVSCTHTLGEKVKEEHPCCAASGIANALPKSIALPNECNGIHTKVKNKANSYIFPVKHDNHYDYLVHSSVTGDIHLEHPCDSCPQNDIHGRLKYTAKRKISNNHNIHFYDVPKEKFNVLTFLINRMDIGCDRVSVIRSCCATGVCANDKDGSLPLSPCCKDGVDSCTLKKSKTSPFVCESDTVNEFQHDDESPMIVENAVVVRSKFYVSEVCCSSEVHQIKKLFSRLEGIVDITFNVPHKLVYVEHYFSPACRNSESTQTITASAICELLNEYAFGGKIIEDGGMVASSNGGVNVADICDKTSMKNFITSIQRSSYVESSFMVSLILENSNLEILEYVSTLIDNWRKNDGNNRSIRRWNLEYTNDRQYGMGYILKVEHDPELLSVNNIHNILLGANVPVDEECLLLESDSSHLRVIVLTDGKALNLYLPVESNPSGDKQSEEELLYEGTEAKLKPNIGIAGIFWLVSLISFAATHHEELKYIKYSALLSCAFSLPPIAKKAMLTLRRCQFDTNGMMMTAIIGALILGEYVEGATVGFLYGFSEYLESIAGGKARRALADIIGSRGVWSERSLLVLEDEKESDDGQHGESCVWVPSSAIPPGSKLLIRPGDAIPCDGIVLQGDTLLNESSLTGEPRGVRKLVGDSVYSGTVNMGSGALYIETTQWSSQSALKKLTRLVEEAQTKPSQTVITIDKFAKMYTPCVLLLAIFIIVIPLIIYVTSPDDDESAKDVAMEWVYHALVLIVVACPCSIVISTPVSYVAALAGCAGNGVIVRGGACLEALGRCKIVCFDKTGTLTTGKFEISNLEFYSNSVTPSEALKYLGMIQSPSSHPIATAVLAYLAKYQHESKAQLKTTPSSSSTVTNWQVIEGKGITGNLSDETQLYCGNERLLTSLFKNTTVKQRASATKNTLYLMTSNELLMSFTASDVLRKESKNVISSLRRSGYQLIMLTGDANKDTACAVAKSVGLLEDTEHSEICFGLLPGEKLQKVEDMQSSNVHRKQYVCMVGDGINDAPALAAADIGVAMGAGAAIAMETSDITLMDDSLHKLEFALQIGRKTIRIIWENIVFSVFFKLLVFLLAFMGKATLWEAILADVGSLLVVTLNAMRLIPSEASKRNILKRQNNNFIA